MAETELHEKIVLEGTEVAESKLGRLAGAVGRVAGAFEGLTELAGVFGGLGAAWKLAEGLRDVDNLYAAVSRISRSTGVSATQAHGMFEAFEKSGVEMESAETVMVAMARMAGKVGGSVTMTAKETAAMNSHMLAMGVNIKKGPVDQMLAMSHAAQIGKLHMNDLTTIFGVQRGQAEKMFLLLKKGPENLKETFEEVKNSSGVIDDNALKSYTEMQKARNELKVAWSQVAQTLYKSVIPAVTSVLNAIKEGFDKIKPIASAIGQALSDHMHTVISLTKTWIALMAANKVLNMGAPMFGGKKMDLIGKGEESGRLMTWGKKAMGFLGNTKAAKAGGMDYFAAKAAFPTAGKAAAGGLGMFETVGGPFARILSSVGGKMGIIGVVITAVVGAFMMLKNNTLGIRDWFVKTFKSIGETFGSIFSKLGALFGFLGRAIQPIAALLGGALLGAFAVIAKVVGFCADAFNWMLGALTDLVNGIIELVNHLPGVNIDLIGVSKVTNAGLVESAKLQARLGIANAAANAAAAKGKRGAPEGQGGVTNQDFRGSKFEINNNFDKGVDGGRVSVVMGDQLAKLGERRIDSGLRPLYSYR